jgi:hypothetical protein
LATIASVEVLGAFRAPTAVKAILAARTAWPPVITTAARTAVPAPSRSSGREISQDNHEKGYRHERRPGGRDG